MTRLRWVSIVLILLTTLACRLGFQNPFGPVSNQGIGVNSVRQEDELVQRFIVVTPLATLTPTLTAGSSGGTSGGSGASVLNPTSGSSSGGSNGGNSDDDNNGASPDQVGLTPGTGPTFMAPTVDATGTSTQQPTPDVTLVPTVETPIQPTVAITPEPSVLPTTEPTADATIVPVQPTSHRITAAATMMTMATKIRHQQPYRRYRQQ